MENKRSFQTYFKSDEDRQYPTEWLFSGRDSSEGQLHFLAYDANLMPLNDITDWNPTAIKEVCEEVSDRFEGYDGDIYLDGVLLDRFNRRLVEER